MNSPNQGVIYLLYRYLVMVQHLVAQSWATPSLKQAIEFVSDVTHLSKSILTLLRSPQAQPGNRPLGQFPSARQGKGQQRQRRPPAPDREPTKSANPPPQPQRILLDPEPLRPPEPLQTPGPDRLHKQQLGHHRQRAPDREQGMVWSPTRHSSAPEIKLMMRMRTTDPQESSSPSTDQVS